MEENEALYGAWKINDCLNFQVKRKECIQYESILQGTSERLFPGCENMWWKNCVCLPEVGKQNATFSPDFTQPGKSLLEVPCSLCHMLR